MASLSYTSYGFVPLVYSPNSQALHHLSRVLNSLSQTSSRYPAVVCSVDTVIVRAIVLRVRVLGFRFRVLWLGLGFRGRGYGLGIVLVHHSYSWYTMSVELT